jgi:hypothetical protein
MLKQAIAIMVVVSATANAAPVEHHGSISNYAIPVSEQRPTNAQVSNDDVLATSNVIVMNEALGTGVPGQGTFTRAAPVFQGENVYHVPQYLPYHPTAATIWPRVVEVPCAKHHGVLKCEGYHWTPAMGRAEYLHIAPTPAKEPVVVTKEVRVPGPTVTILKEVPVKKKRE